MTKRHQRYDLFVLRLTLRDLQFRAGRTFVTTLVVGAVFAVVLIQTGISISMSEEAELAVRRFDAGAWVVEEGVSGPFTDVSTIEGRVASEFRDAGADAAEPVLLSRPNVRLGEDSLYARLVGYEGPLAQPDLLAGRLPRRPTEAVGVLDSDMALGDRLELGSKPLEIVGLAPAMTMTGGDPFLFMRLQDAQERVVGGLDLITTVLISGRPPMIAGFETLTSQEVAEDAQRPFERVVQTSFVVALMLWVAGTGLIGGVTYVAAIERVREFAVVKSYGGSSTALLFGLTLQAVIVAMLAAAVGASIAQVILPRIPIAIKIPDAAYVRLLLLAVGAGLLASIGALRRAVAVDPASAFSTAGQ